MGFFTNLMKNLRTKMGRYIGFQARSVPFDREAWYHDTFRATVDAIASHGAKGKFQAVVMDKEGRIAKVIGNDKMARLLNERPNDIMTGTEFKYRMIANLETKTTAVAYVDWDGSSPRAIYPVDYTSYEFKKVEGGGYAIEFTDYEGETRALPLECCIIMRKFYNDRLASGDGNQPVYKILDMSKASDDGFIESLTVSNKVRGLIKQKKAMLDPADVRKGQDTFAERFSAAAQNGGIVAIDSMEDFQKLDVSPNAANAAQMKEINNRIYTYLRTSEKIVQNCYSEQEGLAWQEGKIEPIWNLFAEAVSAVYYTKHERECGNKMIMTGGVTMGMSVSSIVQILTITRETGDLTTNERRELLGLPPVEGGDERQISLNYVKDENQDKYQGGKDDAGKEDDGGTDAGKGAEPAEEDK
ncbi:MAG: phage portal protein [Butyrivibrio sp.]|nr:phage portal protein [Acetatifactor muris]MCM1560953.1 phage portal protein [Butyrivibrio sp.]